MMVITTALLAGASAAETPATAEHRDGSQRREEAASHRNGSAPPVVEFPERSRRRQYLSKEHFPYADLISEVVAYCYHQLAGNPDCCMDTTYAGGVRKQVLRRPGTEWDCNEECYDTVGGQRGRDVLWAPQGATCSSARVLYLHGGSWLYGSPETLSYGQFGTKLASLTGAVVMVIDYPLTPIGNYSTIMQAAVEAVQWLASHGPAGEDCGGVEAPLFVAGDSAGGGTALSMVLHLNARPELLPRRLAGALFFSPWTNLVCDTPDYYFHGFAEIVDKHSFAKLGLKAGTAYVGDIMFQGHPNQNLDWFTANAEDYVGKHVDLMKDPVASPFHAGRNELVGAPPLHFVVGGSESILGDSVVVAQRAASYGVDVHLDIYPGMWHVFPMYSEGCGSGLELRQATQALKSAALFVRHIAENRRPPFRILLESPPGEPISKTPYTVYNYDSDVHHGHLSLMRHVEAQADGGGGGAAAWPPPLPGAGSAASFALGCACCLLVQGLFARIKSRWGGGGRGLEAALLPGARADA